MKSNGWRNLRPQGDTRKLPVNWQEKREEMVLRLAYFVFAHEIPEALVVNADHTGIMFTQRKGSSSVTREMAKGRDLSLANHGDKRQFTLLATAAADGTSLPHQLVFDGKTSASLPKFAHLKYKPTSSGRNSKGKTSASFKAEPTADVMRDSCLIKDNGSYCLTANHWSDDVTSKAYVTDVAVPYYREMISVLSAQAKC
eukprot:scaffold12735_cov32-Tisochrysis_lutea.AAC.2